MKAIIKFLTWLAANTRLLYAFLVALLIHVTLIAAFGWIKIGANRPRIVASFDARCALAACRRQGRAKPERRLLRLRLQWPDARRGWRYEGERSRWHPDGWRRHGRILPGAPHDSIAHKSVRSP